MGSINVGQYTEHLLRARGARQRGHDVASCVQRRRVERCTLLLPWGVAGEPRSSRWSRRQHRSRLPLQVSVCGLATRTTWHMGPTP